MSNKKRRRLTFEQLESKLPLSTVVQSLHTDDQVAAEQPVVSSESVRPAAAVAWQYTHQTDALLHFVSEHADSPTEEKTDDNGPSRWPLPSEAECVEADHMMEMHDDDFRALMIAESVERN